jgi:hypothetical protein
MAIYTGIPLGTLQEALVQAQTALPPLARGEAVAAIQTGDQRISFIPTTVALLEAHIRALQAAISLLTGGALARKGVYLTGGKGV